MNLKMEELKKMKKIELHAHLNGSISIQTMQKLQKLDQNHNEDDKHLTVVLKQPTTMAEAFKFFPLIHRLIQTPNSLRIATHDVIESFYKDGVVYLELRTTPKATDFMSKQKYIDTVIEAISSHSLPIVVKLLLSIDRRQTVEEAEETINMIINDKTSTIVGLDLSGDPSVDGTKFIPLLRRAKEDDVKMSIHLAELKSCLQEVPEFLALKPDRIGHGSFLHIDQDWIDYIKRHRIPLEVCLTSNQLCMTTTKHEDSHFRFWREHGNPVSLATDDQGLMDTSLSNEYFIAMNTFNLSKQDFNQMNLDSLQMSFIDKTSEEYENILHLLTF